MKSILLLILALTLTACTPQGTVTSEVTVTLTPSPTETPIPIPTEVPLEALPVEELVQKYLAGEIDITTLTAEQLSAFTDSFDSSNPTFEQRKSFSLALDEERDNQRGASPIIYTDRNGDKFYVDPVTLDFVPVGDGTTAEQQTIDNTLPRVVDAEGFTHVYYNNEWIKIEGSNTIQFNNFDNFPWPAGEKINPKVVPEEYRHLLDLTIPEYIYKKYGEEFNMAPFFFLGKEHGQTDIAGHSLKGTVLGYVITENDPFSVTSSMITGAPVLYADNLRADNPGDIVEHSDFYKAITSGNLYYLMYRVDQTKAFTSTYPGSNGQEVTINYKGLAPSNQAHNIITGKLDSNNIALIEAINLVEAGEQTDN